MKCLFWADILPEGYLLNKYEAGARLLDNTRLVGTTYDHPLMVCIGRSQIAPTQIPVYLWAAQCASSPTLL
ncbi:hypothetical protein [Geosporobacter ferrireducens]|uniref:Uncharacterized protein n=1 Tax=Geosporobacter ferrireducens TaxID=1424294 RepID=A0A1D8GMK5_9FIRM|nr:hypothetical protein [Geosporobacter ferrireducens]AOT72134.1 hypothetical protein Gferi_22890 [Geosporobacter ferrireducens]MTI56022.1 hypothetical protein [Geosporobacter ferrireducens]